MKAMISQPMNGHTDEQILAAKTKATEVLEKLGYEVVNTFFQDEWAKQESLEAAGVINAPVFFLAKAVEAISKVDAVYFCSGWENARGCRLEHAICADYHVQLFEG